MYLAISVVAAMCAFLAAVQTRNAKRLGEDLRQKTVEAEFFQLTARTMEERLHTQEVQGAAGRTRLHQGCARRGNQRDVERPQRG